MKRAADGSKNQNVQVVVRVRPLNENEKRQKATKVVEIGPDPKVIKVKEKVTTRVFPAYDKVYGPNSKQIEIYKDLVQPIMTEVLKGYNCTVFAYGPTGTGKTFTMEGERTNDTSLSWENDPLSGIIPRALHHMFETLESQEDCDFSVRVSLIELYNEDLYDLLGTSDNVVNAKLRLFEDPTKKGSVVISGMEEVAVKSRDEVYALMRKGADRRATAATLLNEHSSRSHSVFSVTVHQRESTVDGQELVKTGKLHLVDLAGSECIGRSGAIEKRAREAGNINQSLLTLGRVITALVERAPHVPYRESKLTRLLQDSLGGRTITAIIATVSPASNCIEETLSTLEYATRAKNIKNHPEINQKLTRTALFKEYNDAIDRLKKDLAAARRESGFYINQSNYDGMQSKIEEQNQKIEEAEAMLTHFKNQSEKLREDMDIIDAHYHRTWKKYNETKHKLEGKRRDLKSVQSDLALRTTELHRERFLLEKTEEMQEELYEQAEKLLSVSEDASSDCSALHDKLETRQTVEMNNQKRLAQFQRSLSNDVSDSKTAADNMNGHMDAYIQNTKGAWDQSSDHDVREVRSTEEAVVKMCEQVALVLVNLDREMKEGLDSNGAQLEKTEQTLRARQTAVAALANGCNLLLESYGAQQHERTESATGLVKKIGLNAIEGKSRLESGVESGSAKCTGWTSSLRSLGQKHYTAQSNSVAEAMRDLSSMKQQLQESVNQIKAQMQQQLDAFQHDMQVRLTTTEERICDLSEREDGQLKAIKEHSKTVHSEWQEISGQLMQDSQTHSDICVESCAEATAILDAQMEATDKLISDAQTENNNISNTVSEGTEQIQSQLLAHKSALSTQTSANRSLVERGGEGLCSGKEEMKAMCQASNARIQERHSEQIQTAESALQQLQSGTAELHAQLDKIGTRTNDLVDRDLTWVPSTGDTPARKRWEFPRELTQALPHNDLLSDFERSPLYCGRMSDAGMNATILDESMAPLSPKSLKRIVEAREEEQENISGDTIEDGDLSEGKSERTFTGKTKN